MTDIYIRKDLRTGERRQASSLSPAVPERRQRDRRTACWDIAGCDPATRQECYAFAAGRNCWDVWALRPVDRKYCCLRHADCRQCPVVAAKFRDALYVHMQTGHVNRRSASRSTLCAHLYVDGLTHTLGTMVATLADLLRQDRDIFRCRRRGVHLESNYVSDICASGGHTQCVFLED